MIHLHSFVCCRTEICFSFSIWCQAILCRSSKSILLSYQLLQNAIILTTERVFDNNGFSLSFVQFKNSVLDFMQFHNCTLFTSCQQHFHIILDLMLELNFKNDATYCMCTTNNQEDCSVYHYLRITNSKDALAMISNIPRTTSLFFLLIRAFLFNGGCNYLIGHCRK